MIGVTENLNLVRDLLAKAAIEAGREPGSVRLLAVSKRQPLEKLLEAAADGQRDFGENLLQEALTKIEQTRDESLCWHFIGHLQSNKTRAVAEHFDWVHSIDRLKVAERLSEQRPATLDPLNVCLQVKIDDEDSKSGVAPDDVRELAEAVSRLPRLALRGLMCLPAPRADFDEQRRAFSIVRRLQDTLAGDGLQLDTLSMGMSQDFRAAIFEGATIVRLGTAVFGERH